MSSRHRSGYPDEILLRPDKELRAKEHRRIRHKVGQQLHEVDDPDAAVFVRPKFDHPPRSSPKKKKTRHWKVKAWKRRTAERRRRNEIRSAVINEAM